VSTTPNQGLQNNDGGKEKWKHIARLIMSGIWLWAFLSAPLLPISRSYGAEPQDTIDITYTSILRTFYQVCSFATTTDKCDWGVQKVALWVQGSSSTVLLNVRTSTSGVLGFDYESEWDYNGHNHAHGWGWGGVYSCSACTCTKKNGLAYADAHETRAGSSPECNFSPANTVYPLDENPTLVKDCGGTSYLAKYNWEFTINGSPGSAGEVYTCSNITVDFSTYTDVAYTYFPSPFPVSDYDNQRLYNIIAEGSQNLAQQQPDYYAEIQDNVGSALDYLSDGIDVSTNVGGQNWDNPFQDIEYTTFTANITVNVDLSTVTSKLDDILSFYVDTTTIENHDWASTYYDMDISTAIYNLLYTWFDFSGAEWDTCLTLDFSTVPIGGQVVGLPSSTFCLDTIPGWDVFVNLARFFIVFGVVLWGVTYIW